MTDDFLALTGEIVVAHISHNTVAPSDMPDLIRTTYAAISGLASPAPALPLVPAVPVRASIKPDHIVCLEDGRKLKTLTRHLRAAYGLSPDAYRAKWGLPADYPMVAPAYSEQRRALAQTAGLGRRSVALPPSVPEETPVPVAEPVIAVAPAPDVAKPVRKRLGLVLPKAAAPIETQSGDAADAPVPIVDARTLLVRAIRARTCVRWTYNRTPMLVAPYILYTDRESLYVDAVAREKNGVPPREMKLGRFKLSGLSDISATSVPFPIGEAPDTSDARYGEGIVASATPSRQGRGRL